MRTFDPQLRSDDWYDASGAITTGGTAQLALAQRKSCSFLLIVNNSTGILYVQFGIRPSVATVVGGVVTSVAVSDAGFGLTAAPTVTPLGGAVSGGGVPGWPSPGSLGPNNVLYSGSPAIITANTSASGLGGLQIASFTVVSGGSGYASAPFVSITAQGTDPTGVGIASATAGIPVLANGGSYYNNGPSCPTTAISVWGATTNQAYTIKWLP